MRGYQKKNLLLLRRSSFSRCELQYRMVRYDQFPEFGRRKKKILSKRGRGLLSRTRYLKVEATSREIRRFKTDLMTRDNVRRVLLLVCRAAAYYVYSTYETRNIFNLIGNIQKICNRKYSKNNIHGVPFKSFLFNSLKL